MTVEKKPEPWEQLYRYWQSKCDGERPPARADLDPLIEIPHLTPHLMLIDVLPDGYRYRLAGSDLVSRLGVELTGNHIGRATETEGKWQDMMGMVARSQRPLIVTADVLPPDVGKRLAIVLPLVDKAGNTECIFCGIFFGNDFWPGMRVGDLVALGVPGK